MAKKLLVAVLACITLFLSQRTLTTDARARSVPQSRSEARNEARNESNDAHAATKTTRTASLF